MHSLRFEALQSAEIGNTLGIRKRDTEGTMATKTITIKTRLHEGIYPGGGEAKTVTTFKATPRNLFKAIRQLDQERSSNRKYFGNIRCGASWLEIDGIEPNTLDLEDIMIAYDIDAEGTGTERARVYLDGLGSVS
jgi:hypothetical protein